MYMKKLSYNDMFLWVFIRYTIYNKIKGVGPYD